MTFQGLYDKPCNCISYVNVLVGSRRALWLFKRDKCCEIPVADIHKHK